MSKRILHIHQDYPDGRPYPFTRAVSNLIEATESETHEVSHFVLSINRTSNPFKVSAKKFDRGISVVYWAIPLPLIYLPMMWLCALWCRFLLKGQTFDLVHSHKLTSEGVVGYMLSNWFRVPHIISVRGGSDLHNINRLPCSKGYFRRLLASAFEVFWVSPWAKPKISQKLSIEFARSIPFPNMCLGVDANQGESDLISRQRYVSVLSYHQYQRKGILPLIQAIGEAKKQGTNISLDIYGSGPEEIKNKIQSQIDEVDCSDLIRLQGQVKRQELLQILKKSKGLLLPAVNETFGMCYIESLASGAPILFHSNTGIDGYFANKPGVSVNDQAVTSITTALLDLDSNYSEYFDLVTELNQSGRLEDFFAPNVTSQYLKVIARV